MTSSTEIHSPPGPRLDRAEARARDADALRLLRWLRIGAVVAPALLAVLFGAVTWSRGVERARTRAVDNAVLMQEYVRRLVQTQDVALVAAEEGIGRFRAGGAFDLEAHLFLRRLSDHMGGGLGIAFVGPGGDVRLSSRTFPVRGSIGERDYIEASRGDAELFVDRIRIQPEDVDALVIARRPRGEPFSGVWVSAVEVQGLADFLRRIAGARGDAASILRDDGRLLARSVPMTEPVYLPPDAPGMRAIDRANQGVYEATAITDGMWRIYAYQRVGELPLFAIFGVSRRAIFIDWLVPFVTVAALMAALGVAAYNLARFAARNVEAEAARAALAFDRQLLAEAEKTAALRETMFQELNHRVKNSLQMVQSLIRLQAMRPGGADLPAISARVLAIAAIHDLLYRSSSAFDVDFAALVGSICANDSILPPGGNVMVTCRADPLVLDMGQATPLALCLVELVTNAAKHAYGPAGGMVEVSLAHVPGAGTATLTVADAGRGLPEAPAHSSGLRVLEALVLQVGGTLDVARGGGTRVAITFPLRPDQAGEEPPA